MTERKTYDTLRKIKCITGWYVNQRCGFSSSADWGRWSNSPAPKQCGWTIQNTIAFNDAPQFAPESPVWRFRERCRKGTISTIGRILRAFRASWKMWGMHGSEQKIASGGSPLVCWLKFWRQSRQNNHIGRAKLADFARFRCRKNHGVTKGEFQKSWSQRKQKG